MSCLWMFPAMLAVLVATSLLTLLYIKVYVSWLLDLLYGKPFGEFLYYVFALTPIALLVAAAITAECYESQRNRWHPPLVTKECQCATK